MAIFDEYGCAVTVFNSLEVISAAIHDCDRPASPLDGRVHFAAANRRARRAVIKRNKPRTIYYNLSSFRRDQKRKVTLPV